MIYNMTGRIDNRKKCFCVLGSAVAVMLLAVAGLLSWHRTTERRFGLSPAPEASHEAFATNEDRVRLVIRPEFLLPYIEHYLPEEGETSTTGPSTAELFRELLPREIALLARSDLSTEKIHLTLFANESRGGTSIQERINRANVLDHLPGIEWVTKGLELRGKGCLVAEGNLTFPESFKEARLSYWPLLTQYPPLTINNSIHFIDLTVDNINGEMLTLFAVTAKSLGLDWKNVVGFSFSPPITVSFGAQPIASDYFAHAVSEYIQKICTFHLIINIIDYNSIILLINIRLETNKGLELASLFSWITILNWGALFKDRYNLILDGSAQWDETETCIVGTYTLSGIQPILEDIVGRATTLVGDNGKVAK